MEDRLVTGNKAAQRGEGLAEGAHDQVHVVGEAEVGCRTPPAAQHADGVGIIHHQTGVVFLAEGDDLRQRSDVAAHAENAVHDHELADLRVATLQASLQAGHVVVAEALHLAEGEAAAVNDAGVVIFVCDHDVCPTHQGIDGPQIGLEAGAENQRGLLGNEGRQLALQFPMEFQGAVEEA